MRFSRFIQGFILFLGLCLFSLPASAQDTLEERIAAADRYLAAVTPLEQMVEEMGDAMAATGALPSEKIGELLQEMFARVDMEYLEEGMRRAMVKHFTVVEINAMTDFYTTPEGQAVLNKFGPYMADAMKVIQPEIMRATQEVMREHLQREN